MLTEDQREEMQAARDVLEGLRFLVKSPGWAQAVKLIEANCRARENSIGQKPMGNIEEAMTRNYEVGITHGLKLVPTIILAAATMARETFVRLHDIEQGAPQ